MTYQEAQERATKLGLSAWISQAVTAGSAADTTGTKCVGYSSIDFPLAESENWVETFSILTRLIFSAR